jgi:glucose/arabinose dehydrogenase
MTILSFLQRHPAPACRATGSAVLACLAIVAGSAQAASEPAAKASCNSGAAGIKLPPGFCATVFADNIGHARHMAVSPRGVVYVNTWSGRYYGNDSVPAGGFLVALKDTDGDGKADLNERFGGTEKSGSHGGTGIAIYNGYLYAEVNDRIERFLLSNKRIAPLGIPEVVVSGLPLTGDHPMHPFAIDRDGMLYVDLGSATNACQQQNRQKESPGQEPCTERKTRGGIWRYDAKKTHQKFSPAERFAKGIRNADGIAIDPGGAGVFATQHGRDQLYQDWPGLYDAEQSAALPAEELLRIQEGGDYGWPYCYYDGKQKKLVLAPEYGGDGGKKVGVCAGKKGPLASFPAHWAPNALLLYSAKQFPAAYNGGAFIAFHGSWNRAPLPQAGYNVVFQPLNDGKPSGDYVVFADGFAAGEMQPGEATYRPAGVAQGPDGALYISDDQKGRIWRITYNGDPGAGVEAAVGSGEHASSSPPARQATPPEGVHPDAGKQGAADLPVPPGGSAARLAQGAQLYQGEIADAACTGCHGPDAKGTPLGPDLVDNKWLHGDGSVGSIAKTITDGVPDPKNYRSPMPPMGGASLTHEQVVAIAGYIWALNKRSADARH